MKALILTLAIFLALSSFSYASIFPDFGAKLALMLAADQMFHFTNSSNAGILVPSLSSLNDRISAAGGSRIDKMVGVQFNTLPLLKPTENTILEGEINWFYGWSANANRAYELSLINPNLVFSLTKEMVQDQFYGNLGLFLGYDFVTLGERNIVSSVLNERTSLSSGISYGICARAEYGTRLISTLTCDIRWRFSNLPDFTNEFGAVSAGTGTDLNGLQITFGIHNWF